METCRITYIYGLKDPVSEEVRYIGQALRPKNRYHTHVWKARTNYEAGHKANWIRSLLKENKLPQLFLLASTSIETAHELENYYIQLYRAKGNKRLCNSDAPAESPRFGAKLSQEAIEQRREFNLKRYENKPHNPYMGVAPNGAGSFRTRFRKQGQRIDLGSYPTAEIAAKVWDSAMAYCFPHRTIFNFPDEVIPVDPEILKKRSNSYLNKSSKYYGIQKESRSSLYTIIWEKNKIGFPEEDQAAYYRDCLEHYYNPTNPQINLDEQITKSLGGSKALSLEDVRKISRRLMGKSETLTSNYKHILYIKNNNSYGFDFKIKGERHRKGGYSDELSAVRGFNNYITTNYINKPIIKLINY
jgi:hypothetical protein